MPILGSASKESTKVKTVALNLVDVNGGEVALATGGNIKAQAILATGGQDAVEGLKEEPSNLLFAVPGLRGVELAEILQDLSVFEVNPGDVVIVTTTFDGGPIDDVIGGGTAGIAHVTLFEDFLVTGAGLAIGEELVGDELYAASTIDDIHETKLDGIGHSDFEINVPGAGGGDDLTSVRIGMEMDW